MSFNKMLVSCHKVSFDGMSLDDKMTVDGVEFGEESVNKMSLNEVLRHHLMEYYNTKYHFIKCHWMKDYLKRRLWMEMIKYEISFDIMSFMRYYLIRRHLKECYNNKYHLIKVI